MGGKTTYFDSDNKINLKPQKRNVGYLFQNYALFPNMTVEENVAIGLGKNHDGTVVSEMIKRFHLEGLEKRGGPLARTDSFQCLQEFLS
jgi:molybdate transport system ATP-binding protein